jgi:hypothetical protein
LGNTLLALRKHEASPSKISQSTKVVEAVKLKQPKKHKLKKKVVKKVKKRKQPKRATSNWQNIATNLIQIEKEMAKKEQQLETDRKHSADYLAIPKVNTSKRTRFNTWGNVDEEVHFDTSKLDKEHSVRLEDDKGDYVQNFKNYALKMYDDNEGIIDNSQLKQDKRELTLSLNPCLPILCDKRKVSYHSQNQNQYEDDLENLEKSENSLNLVHGPSKFYDNSKFSKKNSGENLGGESKGKRKRILTSENDSQSSNIAKVAKMKKHKKSRKTSISDSEFNSFYLAYEQHAKNRVDSSEPSASIHSAFNSTKVSPNVKATKKVATRESNLSLKCSDVQDSNKLSP